MGYVDSELSFGLGVGPKTSPLLPVKVDGRLGKDDTMQLGSITKSFTATAVMRLVDEGKLALEDHAYEHIDPAMKRMWNVTMASLFGERAHKVTIRHLLTMRSGIADYE